MWQRRPRGWRAAMDGWSLDLIRRRGLLQLAYPHINGRQRTGRSVFEYAIEADGSWAGGWHGRERQTEGAVEGATITRRTRLDDFAEATVHYQIERDGLHVRREITWLRDVPVQRYYTAMFPLDQAFRPHQSSGMEQHPGPIVTLRAPGAVAGLEVLEGPGSLAVQVRDTGLVKIYASWTPEHERQVVPAGSVHRGHVRYFAGTDPSALG